MAPDFTEQKASDGPSALPCKDCDPQPLPDTPRTENGKLVRGPQVEKTLRCPGHSGGSCHLPRDLICPKTRPGRQYLRILPRLTRLPGAKGLELISKARRHPGGGLWAAITGLQVLGGLRPRPRRQEGQGRCWPGELHDVWGPTEAAALHASPRRFPSDPGFPVHPASLPPTPRDPFILPRHSRRVGSGGRPSAREREDVTWPAGRGLPRGAGPAGPSGAPT